ncbi:MAG: hypothetical protein IPH16_19795 [Haliscomenobacter sp.]|nr:hypothetical protein [Haliscomenobacter sp.]
MQQRKRMTVFVHRSPGERLDQFFLEHIRPGASALDQRLRFGKFFIFGAEKRRQSNAMGSEGIVEPAPESAPI